MSGKISHKISEALRRDDFEQISNYLVESCKSLAWDYTQQGKQLPNNENQIRTILLEEYLDDDDQRKVHGMSGYRFEPETQEHYDGQGNYIGRADIRIILKTDFEKRNAYYLAECKRIDGSDDLNKKYVREGVKRYVTRKYSAYYGKDLMLGFVVKQISISQNAKEIESLQNACADPHMHGSFQLLETKASHVMYKCIYQIDQGQLELRHIFVDFSGVVM